MDPAKILQYCDEIDERTQAIRDEIASGPLPPEPDEVVIGAGDDLQAALSAGGAVALAPEVSCHAPGGYVFETAHTALRGEANNTIRGDTAPALAVPVGVDDISIEALAVASAYSAVLRLGKNDSEQTALDAAPVGIRLRLLHAQSHRGKRVVEVNAAGVEILDCDVYDCYDPGKQDSQAIWIGNAPGPILVEGGYFEAASENLMVGGDSMKIPGCRPTGITIRSSIFVKPLAWKVDGGPPVKNLLELKDGHDVVIDNCDLSQCWKSAQDGYAFMFTPTRGGSVRNVLVRDCRVWDVGGIVNITGTDVDGINPERTQVTIAGGDYRTNKAGMGGSGRFALITRGPEWFVVDSATIAHEGSSFIDVGDSAVVDRLNITNSTWNYGSYGIRIGGANHGDNTRGQIRELVITGNTISGAHSQFRERYPDNTYLSAMSAEREREVGDRAAAYAREVIEDVKRLQQWEREYRL